MKQKGIWIFSSLLVVLVFAFLLRDAMVGIILEKHTIRTCSKLLGGDCSFEGRERSGSTLYLSGVKVSKNGHTAAADDIAVHWEYGWTPPFVSFDVKVVGLRGDAAMLPLYGVWKAVKHASARKGFRLRSWSFEDVALRTEEGDVKFPVFAFEGDGGKVRVDGLCAMPSKGDIRLKGAQDGSWNLAFASASLSEVAGLLHCWSGIPQGSFPPLKGIVSADISYNPSGLKGEAVLHALEVGASDFILSNVLVDFNADRNFKTWKFDSKLGSAPLHVSAVLKREGEKRLAGTINGKDIDVRDIFDAAGYHPRQGVWEGGVDIRGDFDGNGLFALFEPKNVEWKDKNRPLTLSVKQANGKVWVSFAKGLERLWIHLEEGDVQWGTKVKAKVQTDLEVGKNGLQAAPLRACCGDIVLEGRFLATALDEDKILLLSEGGGTKLGVWDIQRFQAKFGRDGNLMEARVEGKAEAKKVLKELQLSGPGEPFESSLPGKVKVEAGYTAPQSLEIKGKWESDLLGLEAHGNADLENSGMARLKKMDLALFIPKVGKMARYALAEAPSYIDFNQEYLELNGRLLPGGFLKNSYPRSFRLAGPWNHLVYEQQDD